MPSEQRRSWHRHLQEEPAAIRLRVYIWHDMEGDASPNRFTFLATNRYFGLISVA